MSSRSGFFVSSRAPQCSTNPVRISRRAASWSSGSNGRIARSFVRLSRRTASLAERLALHDQQRLADQLDLDPVRVLEVERVGGAAVGSEIRNPVRLQLRLQRLELLLVDRDRDVLNASQRLDPRLQPQARKVEKRQQVVVPDVEKQ